MCIHIYTYRYTHTIEYYSAVIKSEIMSFGVTWVDLEIIVLSELSHTKKGKYHITYMWNLKNDANGLIYKTEIDSQT